LSSSFADSPEFQRLLGGRQDIDLARVALEIARDAYPEVVPAPYLARIDALASRARARCAEVDPLRKVLGQINWVLFVEEGFHGNRDYYYDARNSYLNEVLDRKTGIPISLSVLYSRVAEKLGLEVGWLNLPGHVMLRVSRGGSSVIVDPFHEGDLLDREGCLARLGPGIPVSDVDFVACTPALMVVRMLRNLKAIYLHHHDYPAALPVQRRIAALLSDEPAEHLELGVLYLRLDRPGNAIEPLVQYLDRLPEPANAAEVRALLRGARRAAAQRN
jgi:regulator of sirC expression with transglutaminase-like and TPR domain